MLWLSYLQRLPPKHTRLVELFQPEELGNTIGDQNADGDVQKALDVIADEEFLAAAQASNVVAAYCSEEQDQAVIIDEGCSTDCCH